MFKALARWILREELHHMSEILRLTEKERDLYREISEKQQALLNK